MKAMLLERLGRLSENSAPLRLVELPVPMPGPGEVLLKVSVCGVCHTELDEIEGRTPPPKLPVVPGHQVVGKVVKLGGTTRRETEGESRAPSAPAGTVPRFWSCPAARADARPGSRGHRSIRVGDRVGVAWIFSACGECAYCRSGRENLCPDFRATGRDANGGYAEYMTVPEDFAYPIPATFADSEAAPLLCAGAIGYRSLRLAGAGDGQALGLTGFGASGHLVLKLVRHRYPKTRVYVFARSKEEQEFARELGAVWAGATEDEPPELLDAIIDTTPVWQPVVAALGRLRPGGRLVVNAIRKEEADKTALLGFDYPRHLWLEKEVKSVANVTRRDVSEFLELAAEIPLKPEVQEYPLEQANQALSDLKQRRIRGAKVLRISNPTQ